MKRKPPTPDNRRTALPPPAPEIASELDHLMYALRDDLRRADAFITTAERQIEEPQRDDDRDENESEEDGKHRHRMRIEYLVEAGKYAVRKALYTVHQIDAVIAAHRRGA